MTDKERELFTQALNLITELDKEGLVLEMGLILEMRDALSQPEQEPFGYFQFHLAMDAWVQNRQKNKGVPFYTAPFKRQWVGLTSEDWENTPDTGKQGCERDAELFDWIEQTLKEKNT